MPYFLKAGLWSHKRTGIKGELSIFPVEHSYNVEGGTDANQPTFTGDPLFSASHTDTYSKLVYFRINVMMTNITSFGTGQYYMTLPFKTKYDMTFTDGHLHNAVHDVDYQLSGFAEAGSNVIKLNYQGANGLLAPFTAVNPRPLTTADHFHISGVYIKGY